MTTEDGGDDDHHNWEVVNADSGDEGPYGSDQTEAIENMAKFSRSLLAVAVAVLMTIMTLSNDKEVDTYEEQG